MSNIVDQGVRLRAADLQAAQRQSAGLRTDAPERPIVLDIEVLIQTDLTAALGALADLPEPGECIRYVGTPRGLAGLIADVQRLGIADGVALLPLADVPVADLMLEELIPGLTSAWSG